MLVAIVVSGDLRFRHKIICSKVKRNLLPACG